MVRVRQIKKNPNVTLHAIGRYRQRVVRADVKKAQAERALRDMFKQGEELCGLGLTKFVSSRWPRTGRSFEQFVLVTRPDENDPGRAVIVTVLHYDRFVEEWQNRNGDSEVFVKKLDGGEEADEGA